MRYIIGVDGGGTKTVAAVVDENGRQAGSGSGGPANARSVGLAPASANIATAIRNAVRAAGITLDNVSGILMSLAGFDTDLDLPVPQQAIRELAYTGPAIFENDVVGAWAGATGSEPGIVAISGTGATALGMNPRGEFWRTDGWDTLLGDAGSGYAIGRDGIRAAMAMLDGRRPLTQLAAALGTAYGVRTAKICAAWWIAHPSASSRWPASRATSPRRRWRATLPRSEFWRRRAPTWAGMSPRSCASWACATRPSPSRQLAASSTRARG